MPVDAPLYPVNLVLRGRRCLVVGGGRVAAQKIDGLLDADAAVHVIAPVLDPAVERLVRDDAVAVTADRRPYQQGDLRGFHLAITATDDPAVNHAVFLEGEASGVWVNSADDPANCSALLPSRIRRGPLLVTFSTSGEAPAVAKWLRKAYEGEFGSEYVTLIELVAEQRRRIRSEGGSTEGMSWQKALDSGTLDLIREGNLAEAKERLQACLSSSSD